MLEIVTFPKYECSLLLPMFRRYFSPYYCDFIQKYNTVLKKNKLFYLPYIMYLNGKDHEEYTDILFQTVVISSASVVEQLRIHFSKAWQQLQVQHHPEQE